MRLQEFVGQLERKSYTEMAFHIESLFNQWLLRNGVSPEEVDYLGFCVCEIDHPDYDRNKDWGFVKTLDWGHLILVPETTWAVVLSESGSLSITPDSDDLDLAKEVFSCRQLLDWATNHKSYSARKKALNEAKERPLYAIVDLNDLDHELKALELYKKGYRLHSVIQPTDAVTWGDYGLEVVGSSAKLLLVLPGFNVT